MYEIKPFVEPITFSEPLKKCLSNISEMAESNTILQKDIIIEVMLAIFKICSLAYHYVP